MYVIWICIILNNFDFLLNLMVCTLFRTPRLNRILFLFQTLDGIYSSPRSRVHGENVITNGPQILLRFFTRKFYTRRALHSEISQPNGLVLQLYFLFSVPALHFALCTLHCTIITIDTALQITYKLQVRDQRISNETDQSEPSLSNQRT